MWSIHTVECCSDFKKGRFRHREASCRMTGKPDSARTGIPSSEVHDQDGGGLGASL